MEGGDNYKILSELIFAQEELDMWHHFLRGLSGYEHPKEVIEFIKEMEIQISNLHSEQDFVAEGIKEHANTHDDY